MTRNWLLAVNYFGITKTVGLTNVVVALVLVALAACLLATLAGGAARTDRLWPLAPVGAHAVLDMRLDGKLEDEPGAQLRAALEERA